MTLLCKPTGRGYRLRTTMRIDGGHMERALTFEVGSTFLLGGIKWRVLQVLA